MSAFGNDPSDFQDFRGPSLKRKRNKDHSMKHRALRDIKSGRIEIANYLDIKQPFDYSKPSRWIASATPAPALSRRELFDAAQEAGRRNWRCSCSWCRPKDGSARREAKRDAGLCMKDSRGRRKYWYGDEDTTWDYPPPIEEQVDWFDCHMFCYWYDWDRSGDSGVCGTLGGFGVLVDRALETRAGRMRLDLDRAGWVEVDGDNGVLVGEEVGTDEDDDWIEVDSDGRLFLS